MTLTTLDRVQQGALEQLYHERVLLIQVAARLCVACGYPISVVPDPDDTMIYLTLGLPTGAVTVGLPPEDLHLALQAGPTPYTRQTMRERAQTLAAFLAATH